MTKREAKAKREAWRKAVAEGRVVRYGAGERFESYKSSAEALAAVANARQWGLVAAVVTP